MSDWSLSITIDVFSNVSLRGQIVQVFVLKCSESICKFSVSRAEQTGRSEVASQWTVVMVDSHGEGSVGLIKNKQIPIEIEIEPVIKYSDLKKK